MKGKRYRVWVRDHMFRFSGPRRAEYPGVVKISQVPSKGKDVRIGG
jgi:hypothetical protein